MKLRTSLALAAVAALLLGSIAGATPAMARKGTRHPHKANGNDNGGGGTSVSQDASGGDGGEGGDGGRGGNVICQNVGGFQSFGGGVPAGAPTIIPIGTL